MKKLPNLIIVFYLLLYDYVVFAQPVDEDDGNDLEGNDPPAAPINSKIFLLFLFCLIYLFIKVKDSIRDD